MERHLEICAADISSVLAAKAGGADRVELCTGLAEGGTTPSDGLVAAALQTGIRVHVLVRPRPGNFTYDAAEKDVIRRDIANAVRLGAQGVVVGALTPGGDIDTEVVEAARKTIGDLGAAGTTTITFHRAFDRCRDPFAALDTLIEFGVDYLLTSGQAASAREGAPLLARLAEHARGRIRIIAAAGINSANVAEIARRTGCTDFHASARVVVPQANPDPLFPTFFPSDKNEVAKLAAALKL